MIDSQSGIAGERVPEIFPERVDPLIGMQHPQRVGPALRAALKERIEKNSNNNAEYAIRGFNASPKE
jgi:hypothetical protein